MGNWIGKVETEKEVWGIWKSTTLTACIPAATCGEGRQRRQRKCDCYNGDFFDGDFKGKEEGERKCNLQRNKGRDHLKLLKKTSAVCEENEELKCMPPRNMVKTNKGIADADEIGNADHLPEYAFQNTDTRYWQGSFTSYPQNIWFQFPTPHILTGIDVTPNRNGFGPKRFRVAGSNDLGKTWESMLEVANSGFPNDLMPGVCKYWEIPTTRSYQWIGLKIFSIPIGAYGSSQIYDSSPEVKSIVFWEDQPEKFAKKSSRQNGE